MSHHTSKSAYRQLEQRLNKHPQGAPPSDLLFRIFSILFTEEDACALARLPLRPFSAAKAAKVWRMSEDKARTRLEDFASRGMMLDLVREDGTTYLLPPPMAGFFEFSLMRIQPDIDQKELSKLFFEYINVDEAFVRDLFANGETAMGRVLVSEPAIAPEDISQVLDYERASEIIRTASDIAVGICYCRHKMSHVGRACDAPTDNCMTLNKGAASLIRHGIARRVDTAEGLDILQRARERNLVQCADNVQKGVNFICNCCGCCCEGLLAIQRLAIPNAMYTTNFIMQVDGDQCTGCGRCAKVCPVGAIAVEDAGKDSKRIAGVNEEICIGCGVCVGSCPAGAVRLAPREKRILTPVNTAHRLVLMAIERGKLQNLIFDNQAYLSHRVMAAVLGAILKLPPLKRALASRQFKSRYLARVMEDVEVDDFSS